MHCREERASVNLRHYDDAFGKPRILGRGFGNVPDRRCARLRRRLRRPARRAAVRPGARPAHRAGRPGQSRPAVARQHGAADGAGRQRAMSAGQSRPASAGRGAWRAQGASQRHARRHPAITTAHGADRLGAPPPAGADGAWLAAGARRGVAAMVGRQNRATRRRGGAPPARARLRRFPARDVRQSARRMERESGGVRPSAHRGQHPHPRPFSAGQRPESGTTGFSQQAGQRQRRLLRTPALVRPAAARDRADSHRLRPLVHPGPALGTQRAMPGQRLPVGRRAQRIEAAARGSALAGHHPDPLHPQPGAHAGLSCKAPGLLRKPPRGG